MKKIIWGLMVVFLFSTQIIEAKKRPVAYKHGLKKKLKHGHMVKKNRMKKQMRTLAKKDDIQLREQLIQEIIKA